MENVLEFAKYIGLFIAGCVIAYTTCKKELSSYFNKQKLKVSTNLPKQSSLDVKIVEKMEYTKELLNADHIQVYEFHNGEHYSDGRSAMKLSCTYEVDKASVMSIRHNSVGIPIACIPHFVDKILTDGKFFCDDLEKLKVSMPATYEFKKSNSIGCFADYAIKNKYNQIVAFIAVIWNNPKDYNANELEIEKLALFVENKLDEMPKD